MDTTEIDWITKVTASIEEDITDPDFQGEMALAAGRFALKRADLDLARRLLNVAVQRISDVARKPELASQLIALARAWDRRRPAESARAESALRDALELDRGQALPAYAQFLQRRKRLPEAITQWREAIRAQPAESSYYLNLARICEQSGQPEQALTVYLELMDAVPTAGNYLMVAQRLDELAPRVSHTSSAAVRIALLGNATLDHLQSYAKVECYRAGLRPQVYQSGFDQYTQDILDPESMLYDFSPEVIVCAIHASRLFPRIHQYPFDMTPMERQAEMEAGLSAIQNLLDTLTSRTSAMVLVHNMVAPQFPALGIQDWRDELGQTELFAQINARLAALVRNRYQNVYIVDEDRLQARAGKNTATDPRLWFTSRMGWSHTVLSELAREYLRYLKPYKTLSRKCIVLDLDNTLWGGVIGEDGIGGIQLGADAPGNGFMAFQRELERLWRRGILLAIASKNNLDDVLPVFEQHPGMILKLAHFASQRINWKPKTENIREIARELNIGLDSLVFLDDNPVERARMRAELPQVLTPELPTDPAYYRQALLDLDVFETLALTEEDRRRNQLYAEQTARRDFETRFETAGGSLDEYLAALEMVVEIEPANPQAMPRIAQLTNKTNQFNLTTRRYSEAQINEMRAAGCQVFSMRVADRFGDNGLVGVAILVPRDASTWELDTLLMSCRVMGRGVETAFLAYLAEWARECGVRCLQGWYLPTAKNSPVKDVYRKHRFTLVERQPTGNELWQLDLETEKIGVPGWLTVNAALPVG